jgi:class 3 adenylate cyclase
MLGKIEFEKGNAEQAISYLDSSYIKAKANNQKQDILGALFELGNVYQKTDPNKALNFYKESEVLAKELEMNSELRDIYEGMFQIYADKRDFNNAFNYQSQYLVLKNSLFNIEKADTIRGLQFAFDLLKKQDEIEVLQKEAEISELNAKRQKIVNYASASASILILLLAFSSYRRYKFAKKTNIIIEEEKNRSQKLLLNILPKKTASELIHKGKVQAKKFSSVTVMFTDFKDFTRYSHDLSPDDLVKSVDFYFSKFDAIIEKYGLEKIKTIGDSYMCAGGLPFPTIDHADKILNAALEIVEFMEESRKSMDDQISHFDIRIGINSGPVVAGVVGTIKFAYDIWGDTVNVASRMESMSIPGKINISENTYNLVKEKYDCEIRGEFHVKNKGMMKMYFVTGIKEKKLKKQTLKKVE